MSDLFPCPSCRRHVRDNSEACPFCGISLPQAPHAAVEPPRGVSRSAMLAFGAALAGSAALGCSGDIQTGSSSGGGGAGGEPTTNTSSTTNSASTASGSGSGGGGQGGAGGQGGQGGIGTGSSSGQGGTGNIQPPYGSPPVDGGP